MCVLCPQCVQSGYCASLKLGHIEADIPLWHYVTLLVILSLVGLCCCFGLATVYVYKLVLIYSLVSRQLVAPVCDLVLSLCMPLTFLSPTRY